MALSMKELSDYKNNWCLEALKAHAAQDNIANPTNSALRQGYFELCDGHGCYNYFLESPADNALQAAQQAAGNAHQVAQKAQQAAASVRGLPQQPHLENIANQCQLIAQKARATAQHASDAAEQVRAAAPGAQAAAQKTAQAAQQTAQDAGKTAQQASKVAATLNGKPQQGAIQEVARQAETVAQQAGVAAQNAKAASQAVGKVPITDAAGMGAAARVGAVASAIGAAAGRIGSTGTPVAPSINSVNGNLTPGKVQVRIINGDGTPVALPGQVNVDNKDKQREMGVYEQLRAAWDNNKLKKQEKSYRGWKDHTDYRTYVKLRKFLQWHHAHGRDSDFDKYFQWKANHWVPHYDDNHHYEDFCAWKQAFGFDDYYVMKKWKDWKSKKHDYKRHHKKYLPKACKYNCDTYGKDAKYNHEKKQCSLRSFCKFRRYADWSDHCAILGKDVNDMKEFHHWKQLNNKNYHPQFHHSDFKAWKGYDDWDGYQKWHTWKNWRRTKGCRDTTIDASKSCESSCPSVSSCPSATSCASASSCPSVSSESSCPSCCPSSSSSESTCPSSSSSESTCPSVTKENTCPSVTKESTCPISSTSESTCPSETSSCVGQYRRQPRHSYRRYKHHCQTCDSTCPETC